MKSFFWIRSRLFRRSLRVTAVVLYSAIVAGCSNDSGSAAVSGNTPSRSEAARFLSQSTFGPNEAEIERLVRIGYTAWLEDQFNKAQQRHRDYLDLRSAQLAPQGLSISQDDFFESFWSQALARDDQLRQRTAFALSQIFVISLIDGALSEQLPGVSSYYDMLSEKAMGNFRDLLEGVALHPMMGIYLSSLQNQKESETRIPDENFARELVQLFSVGLHELKPDGTLVLDARGAPIETYTNADIAGLAKVFTGWSWYAGESLTDRTSERFFGLSPHPERDRRPMQAYSGHVAGADFHSTSEKTFFGRTIAAQIGSSADSDLAQALDTIFLHPNVGPFIGRQLIQRLVTSNPSPKYVERVAAAFNDSHGVRGNMKAVYTAILMDPEARLHQPVDAGYGKLREPVLRLANFLRAFNARSASGRFLQIDNTDDPANRLSQSPLRAPSVFNFFRPGFVPPNSDIAAAKLVAPEFQIVSEISVAGYLNYIQGWLSDAPAGRDIKLDFSKEVALAGNANSLVDRMNLLLMSGQMTPPLRRNIIAAVSDRTVPSVVLRADGSTLNQNEIDTALLDRVRIAIFLTLASPDFMVQK